MIDFIVYDWPKNLKKNEDFDEKIMVRSTLLDFGMVWPIMIF